MEVGKLGERKTKRLCLGNGIGCSVQKMFDGVVHLKPICFWTNITPINSIKNEIFHFKCGRRLLRERVFKLQWLAGWCKSGCKQSFGNHCSVWNAQVFLHVDNVIPSNKESFTPFLWVNVRPLGSCIFHIWTRERRELQRELQSGLEGDISRNPAWAQGQLLSATPLRIQCLTSLHPGCLAACLRQGAVCNEVCSKCWLCLLVALPLLCIRACGLNWENWSLSYKVEERNTQRKPLENALTGKDIKL